MIRVRFCFLVLALTRVLPLQGEPPDGRVKIELVTRIVEGELLEGFLLLRPISSPGEPITVPVKGVRQLTLSLPARTVWEVQPEIRRYWAGRTRIEVKGTEEVADYILGLWPKSTLAGSVTVEKGERLPGSLAVRLRTARLPGRKVDVPELTVECPIGKQGEWTCDLPATLLDLSVAAKGFVPHHRWATRLERDKTLSLGRLSLKKGASVSGWVQVEEGALDPKMAKARLVPLVAPGGNASLAERLRGSALQVSLDSRGFFQFAGVNPGSYSVEVTQPDFAPAQVSPVEVWAGSETSLTQPLILRRPLRIEIAISPELDWLGKPWHAEVTRAPDLGGHAGLAYEGTADASGRIVLPEQAPGTYRIVVFDSLGNPLYSDLEVPIRDAGDQQRTIEIDLVDLKGEVLLGNEPLAATLYFGGRNAAMGSRMESDEEGVFHGVLPRQGTWLVDIEAEEPALSTPYRADVQARRDGTARLTIRIPDTRVFGRVVDDEDRPMAAARVFVFSGQGDAETATAEGGAFELRGLPEGPVRLSAEARSRAGDLVSETTLVVLNEGQPAGPLELRLRRNKPFAGRVQSARGPVPGAALEIFPLKPLLPGAASARSDLQGNFEVRVPEPAQSVLAVVSPPGNNLKGFEVPLDGRPAVLEVSQEGGSLEITAGSQEEMREQSLEMVVFQNGLRIPWDALLRWAQGHGERLRTADGFRIPSVAPGDYRLCLVSRAELVQRGPEGPSGLGVRCASGYLETGGTLRLDLTPR